MGFTQTQEHIVLVFHPRKKKKIFRAAKEKEKKNHTNTLWKQQKE